MLFLLFQSRREHFFETKIILARDSKMVSNPFWKFYRVFIDFKFVYRARFVNQNLFYRRFIIILVFYDFKRIRSYWFSESRPTLWLSNREKTSLEVSGYNLFNDKILNLCFKNMIKEIIKHEIPNGQKYGRTIKTKYFEGDESKSKI